MLFSELKCKDVINLKDCRKLGRICDLEFDKCSGQICKVIIPSGNRFLNILCQDIKQIGPDIIIVDLKC